MENSVGKGINSLFSQNKQKDVNNNSHQVEVNLSDIFPNKNQPRKEFHPEQIQELADSIKAVGLIQPIVVKKSDNGYEIIAGERRWRACKLAGLTTIPVVLKNEDDKKTDYMSLIENVHRKDLNCIEVSDYIQQLINEYKLTQEELASELGMNRSVIANYLRINNLPEFVKISLKKDEISFGHAKILAGIKDEKLLKKVFKRLIENKLSVSKLTEHIISLSKIKNNENKKESDSEDFNFSEYLTLKMKEYNFNIKKVKENKVTIEIDINDLNKIFKGE